MVWYRAHVQLTRAQARQAATLSLGELDDKRRRVINGRAMGSGFGAGEHAYAVPAKLLEAGDNLVVVNVSTCGARAACMVRREAAVRLADARALR